MVEEWGGWQMLWLPLPLEMYSLFLWWERRWGRKCRVLLFLWRENRWGRMKCGYSCGGRDEMQWQGETKWAHYGQVQFIENTTVLSGRPIPLSLALFPPPPPFLTRLRRQTVVMKKTILCPSPIPTYQVCPFLPSKFEFSWFVGGKSLQSPTVQMRCIEISNRKYRTITTAHGAISIEN